MALFCVGTVGGFALFYTGYSKATHRLEPQRVLDLFGTSGATVAIAQWNKLLGLSGVTLLGAAAASYTPSLMGAFEVCVCGMERGVKKGSEKRERSDFLSLW
jgi:hypothetical protein